MKLIKIILKKILMLLYICLFQEKIAILIQKEMPVMVVLILIEMMELFILLIVLLIKKILKNLLK